jgi:hypothetical protein
MLKMEAVYIPQKVSKLLPEHRASHPKRLFLIGIDVFVSFKGQQMYIDIYGALSNNSTFKREKKNIVTFCTLDILMDHCAYFETILQLVASSPGIFSSCQWTASKQRYSDYHCEHVNIK